MREGAKETVSAREGEKVGKNTDQRKVVADEVLKQATKGTLKALKFGWKQKIIHSLAAIGIATGSGAGAGKYYDAKGAEGIAKDTVAGVSRALDITAEGASAAVGRIQDSESAENDSQVQVEALSTEEKKTIDEVIDIFYPGTEESDREELGNQIKITAEYMKEILTPESYQNINNNELLIEDIARYSGVPKEIFLGLTLAESRGGVDGNTANGAGALGPVQITEMKGLDYGLSITNDENDDRLKWDRALAVAALDISQKTRYFSGEDPAYQNWGLGVWSWHKGQTGVKQEIESYSANKVQSYTDLQKYIRENNITVKSILDIPNIRKRLEEPGNNYDTTTLFVLRVAGGALLVKNMEKLADPVTQQQ